MLAYFLLTEIVQFRIIVILKFTIENVDAKTNLILI